MMNSFEGKQAEVTEKVIGVFFKVYNQLGYGFLEKVYENALRLELEKMGLMVEPQKAIQVYYDDQVVGEYFVDLCVNNAVLVEIKAVRQLSEQHEAQLVNYLKSTRYEVGLLLNFGPKAQHVRKVFDNERKGNLSWVK